MKAGIEGLLLVTIITIIALIAILLIFSGVFRQTDDTFAYKNCQASIEKYIAKTKLTQDYTTGSIECKTRSVRIADTKKEAVERQIAEEMRSCWSTFKEGKVRFFAEEGMYCHPCAIVSLNKAGKTITDFNTYTFRTHMVNSNLTYADYFMGFETPQVGQYYNESNAEDIQSALVLNPQKKYAIVYFHAFGMDAITATKEKMGGNLIASGYGFAGGFVAGALTIAAGLALFPEPIGTKIAAAIIVVGAFVIASISALVTYFSGHDPQWLSMVLIMEYNPDQLQRLGCQTDNIEQGMFGNVNP